MRHEILIKQTSVVVCVVAIIGTGINLIFVEYLDLSPFCGNVLTSETQSHCLMCKSYSILMNFILFTLAEREVAYGAKQASTSRERS